LNRVRYRRDETLLNERAGVLRPCFILLGQGALKHAFAAELGRHRLLYRAGGKIAPQKILFNPLANELDDSCIAAVVLDDDYMLRVGQDAEIVAALVQGPEVVVLSDTGLRHAQQLGVPLRRISLVPAEEKRMALRLGIGRWLVYLNALAPERYLQDLLDFGPPIRSRSCVCISLPEYLDRRAEFTTANDLGFAMFNGIRMLPGWKGCGWSYKAIAVQALQSGARRLTICEDDACFGPDFQQYFSAINRYLDRTGWDVFNGVMTRIDGRPEIMMRRRLGDNHIIHTPHMMGMVFNVYNRTALEWIADWNPDNGGAQTNTIDEWLNAMPGLRVVSAVPFLASHREEVHSTIFGFKNTRYSSMIRATEREIMAMVGPV
jgi:hypothetical protein